MSMGDVCGYSACNLIVERKGATYCTPQHQMRAEKVREKVRRKERNAIARAIKSEGTAGALIARNIGLPLYKRYVELGLHQKMIDKDISPAEVADMLQCGLSTVYRMKEYKLQEDEYVEAANAFQPETWAQQLLEDFPKWREAFFEVRAGVPYVTKPFHQRWIDQLLRVIETNGRGLVLSPPRHGKTDLLIHFVVWSMIRNPDISIMWVSKNALVARRSLKAVKQILEHHTLLRETYLPPGQFWKPDRRTGLEWSAKEIFLANATVVGQKSPTLQALGAGQSIINQDVTIMVCDDIEDSVSTKTEGSREDTRRWWVTDIGSRVMTNTATFVIGSRQHADDLYARLLLNPTWETIIEHAHDPDCPREQYPLHEHTDCMLWPEMNSYEWFLTQRLNADTTGGRKLFEMVYQNTVEKWSTVIFQRPHLEQCRNYDRPVGKYPSGLRLVGGLDPSITGFQAAVLWGFDLAAPKQYLIDVDNEEGGGAPKALRQMKAWREKYGLAHWVVETNWDQGYGKDRDITEWARREGVRIEGHDTHTNKWDERFGLKAFADRFEERIIDLPYADVDSQAATDTFIHQAVMTEPGVKARGGAAGKYDRGIRSDVVMAAWFPQKEWERQLRKQLHAAQVVGDAYDPIYRDYHPEVEVAV